jgi:acetyl esterase/lipase
MNRMLNWPSMVSLIVLIVGITTTAHAQQPPGATAPYILPEAKVVKGAFFITSGYRFKEYQELAAKHDLVLIQFVGPPTAYQKVLTQVAKDAKHPEIEHANYICWGHSAGGVGVAKAADKLPERMIAGCIIRSPNEKDEPKLEISKGMPKVPLILTPALRDGFVPVSAPTALFERGRKEDAVWTLAIEPGGTHAPEGATNIVVAWLDAVIKMRLPADGDYAKGPVKLNEIDVTKGWLGDVKTFDVGAFDTFKGEKVKAAWLPNETVAKQWKTYVSAAAKPGAGPKGPQPQPGGPKAQSGGPGGLDVGKLHADLEYATVGKKSLKLDLYLPEQSDGPVPLIIHVHGGGWSVGNKKAIPTNGGEFVKKGYAVASIQYRLSGEAIFPAAIQDCKAAVRWLRANSKKYNLDPDHFAAWGGSAGGHLVALLGTSTGVKEFDVGENLDVSSKVQAVCDWFGPTDFLQMNAQAKAGAGSGLDHDSPKSPESHFIGGAIQDNKEKCAKANPITYITKEPVPFLIVHGERDNLVPIGQSRLLEAALSKAGGEVKLVALERAGHGGPGFSEPGVTKQMMEFFDKHLKKTKENAPAKK